MSKINLYIISKDNKKDEYSSIIDKFIVQMRYFCSFNISYVWNKDISNSHKIGSLELIQSSYIKAFSKYMSISNCYNIAFSPNSLVMDSSKFANILSDRSIVNFFIGGAYGFSSKDLTKFDIVVSLSSFVMSHKLALIVSLEQIYRSLCINNNHPYHK